MIKPQKLKKGDMVALVSLSAGIAGESLFRHRVEMGIKRLKEDFGLKVMTMPNALKGIVYLDKHPEARAKDLMEAFKNPEIKAVIAMIGGDDTIRLLPYIDFTILKNNPKIFMGYSDTTVNHFMMYKAGFISFYGPCVMCEFAENAAMHEYTKTYINKVLFETNDSLEIPASPEWTSEMLEWTDSANNEIARKMIPEQNGYMLLQGKGKVEGRLLGGCIDVFPMLIGTELWPQADEWKGCILFLETSEEEPAPADVKYLLRGLVAQGIIDNINGIIVGKPCNEKYFAEYKEVLIRVVNQEAGHKDMPILYNMNFGHNAPLCILPYGAMAEIDCDKKSFWLKESAVE
ncbi:MAG: S66 family peptidase [Lachnospiraceae bacterium]